MPYYRIGATRDLLIGSRYRDRFRAMRPNNLLAYWPLNEKPGTAGAGSVLDWSGNARHATPSNVTFGVSGIMGETCASFDGASSIINIYSAGLAAAFNKAEGTLFAWARVSGAGVWTDGTQRHIVSLRADGNNRAEFIRQTTNDLLGLQYDANSVLEFYSPSSPMLDWFSLGMTWSAVADIVYFYVNGEQKSSSSILGAWSLALSNTTTNIGAMSSVLRFWSGNICNVGIWSTPLNSGEIKKLARLN